MQTVSFDALPNELVQNIIEHLDYGHYRPLRAVSKTINNSVAATVSEIAPKIIDSRQARVEEHVCIWEDAYKSAFVMVQNAQQREMYEPETEDERVESQGFWDGLVWIMDAQSLNFTRAMIVSYFDTVWNAECFCFDEKIREAMRRLADTILDCFGTHNPHRAHRNLEEVCVVISDFGWAAVGRAVFFKPRVDDELGPLDYSRYLEMCRLAKVEHAWRRGGV